MPRPTLLAANSIGALIWRTTRSSAFKFVGAFMLARRKKNGTARRPMTIPTSRYRLNADTTHTDGHEELVRSPEGEAHLADRDLLQELHVIERLAASEHDRADRVVA